MATETSAPRITKGIASTTMLNVSVTKSCSAAGKEGPEAPAAQVFSHSETAAIAPNTTTKVTRKRTAVHPSGVVLRALFTGR